MLARKKNIPANINPQDEKNMKVAPKWAIEFLKQFSESHDNLSLRDQVKMGSEEERRYLLNDNPIIDLLTNSANSEDSCLSFCLLHRL